MRILFLCPDNGARSQMAEALARQMFGSEIEVLSAGVEAGGMVHPMTIACLKEVGINVQGHKVRTLQGVDLNGVTLCVVVCARDVSVDQVPKTVKKLLWPLMDPLDPPAGEAELKSRFADLRTALSKHLKGITRVKKQLAAS